MNDWFLDIAVKDPDTADQIADAIELLARRGPLLGRPLVDRIHGSKLHNLKELRPGSVGRSEVRLLFVFDVEREARHPGRRRQERGVVPVVRHQHPAGGSSL
ncbi:type II toxin-antitoxin system RelE/ParE family toxin [Kitasatospora sp. NPDC127067]|uniref:type II toxin-antitoxin system RelE/ParE family toxin n=1 Tax=Kitasatospora sp. NPDC127067 TaxID=3347126 RepID=UPI0036498373